MQQGRGGMGNHKHGIHGHSGPSPRAKLMRALEANRTAEEEKRQRPKAHMVRTIAELFRGHHAKP